MEKKYIVDLTKKERKELKILVKTGKNSAKKLLHARILLQSDANTPSKNKTASEIAEALDISSKSVYRVRQRFVEEGLESALNRRKHSRTKPRKLDGEGEAHLVALCCSEPPQGRARWTLSLLSDQLIRLNIVDSISATTVSETLKKTNLSRGKK